VLVQPSDGVGRLAIPRDLRPPMGWLFSSWHLAHRTCARANFLGEAHILGPVSRTAASFRSQRRAGMGLGTGAQTLAPACFSYRPAAVVSRHEIRRSKNAEMHVRRRPGPVRTLDTIHPRAAGHSAAAIYIFPYGLAPFDDAGGASAGQPALFTLRRYLYLLLNPPPPQKKRPSEPELVSRPRPPPPCGNGGSPALNELLVCAA